MCTRVALHFDKDQVGHWVYPQPHATKVWLTSWMLTAGGAPSSGQTIFCYFLNFFFFCMKTHQRNISDGYELLTALPKRQFFYFFFFNFTVVLLVFVLLFNAPQQQIK